MARSRIRSPADFKAIYGGKRSIRNRDLTIYHRAAPGGAARLGLSVGRRLGNAVVRNRIKRVLREVFRIHGGAIPAALDLVVIPRSARTACDFHRMSKAFLDLMGRLARSGEGGL